jgi:hypothetical protein
VGKLEGRRPIATHRYRWKDNIKFNHRVLGWGGVDWIHLVLGRDQWRVLVKTLMDIRVP